jgi:hypothetical protein
MRWLFVMLLALAACRTSTQAAPPPTASWEVPIVLEPGQPPMVDVTVGGKTARFIIDTTAADTALAAWFAKSLAPGPLPLSLGPDTMRTAAWPTLPSDGDLEARGIGGVLAPHRLLERGAVALDFPRRRMVGLAGQQMVWLRWLDERSPKSVLESLVRVGPRDAGLFVKSRVGDGREVITRLATTAQQSSYAAALFDEALLAGGPVLKGLHVRLGDSDFPLDTLITPSVDRAEGQLGLDALATRVLLMPMLEGQALWVMTPLE